MKSHLPESCKRFGLARVRKVLIENDGNISRSAKKLKVPAKDLRRMALANPEMIEAVLEASERSLDLAEAQVMDQLRSKDASRALEAASFILKTSKLARRRGW